MEPDKNYLAKQYRYSSFVIEIPSNICLSRISIQHIAGLTSGGFLLTLK